MEGGVNGASSALSQLPHQDPHKGEEEEDEDGLLFGHRDSPNGEPGFRSGGLLLQALVFPFSLRSILRQSYHEF